MRSFLLCVLCAISVAGFSQQTIPVKLYPIEGETYDKGAADMQLVMQVSNDTNTIFFQLEITDDRLITKGNADRLDIWLGIEKNNYLQYNSADVLTKPFEDSTINWMDENERKTYYLNNRSWNYIPDSISQDAIDEVVEQILFMGTTHWQLNADGSMKYVQDSVIYLHDGIEQDRSVFGNLSSNKTKKGYTLNFSLDKRGLGMLYRSTYELFCRIEVTDVDAKGRTTRYATDSISNGGIPLYLDVRIPLYLNIGSDGLPFSIYGLRYFFEEGGWQPYKMLMEQQRWFSLVGQLLLQKLEPVEDTLYFDSIPYTVLRLCSGGSFGESVGETRLSFDHPKLNGSISFNDGTCDRDNHILYQLNNGHFALMTRQEFNQHGDGFGTCGACTEVKDVYYITDSLGTLEEVFRIHTNEGLMSYNIPGTSGQGWISYSRWSDDKTTFILSVINEDMELEESNTLYYLEFNEDYTEYSIRTEVVVEE